MNNNHHPSAPSTLDIGDLTPEEVILIGAEISHIASSLDKLSDRLHDTSGRLERANCISPSNKLMVGAVLSAAASKALDCTCPVEQVALLCAVMCVKLYDHELMTVDEANSMIDLLNRDQNVRDCLLTLVKR